MCKQTKLRYKLNNFVVDQEYYGLSRFDFTTLNVLTH